MPVIFLPVPTKTEFNTLGKTQSVLKECKIRVGEREWEDKKSCYFWFTDEVLQCRKSNSEFLEVNARIHFWLSAGQAIIPVCADPFSFWPQVHPSLWIFSLPNLGGSGKTSLFCIWFSPNEVLRCSHKGASVVILIFQLWKPGKAKWCPQGHTPVSEAEVGSPCPLFLPSLSHKPKEQ